MAKIKEVKDQEIITTTNAVGRVGKPCRIWENIFTLKTLVIVFAIIIARDSWFIFHLLTH